MGNAALSEAGFGIGMAEVAVMVAVVAVVGPPGLVCERQRYARCNGWEER